MKPRKCTVCPSICCHMKPYKVIVYELELSKHFLCKMNNREVVYIIGVNIHNCLSISCNVCIIIIKCWSFKQFTISRGTDRLTHAQSHECSALASQIQELVHKKIPEEVCSSWTVGWTKLSRLILLLYC